MARNRMIRPEFWTDGKISECSVSARLLFIGTWTYADDNGNLDMCAKQLHMQIFPGDKINIIPLLEELITHGLLIPYSVSGGKYLNIKNFHKHQKINRPSPSIRPVFNESLILTEYSLSTQPEVKRSEVKERSKTRKTCTAYTDGYQQFWNVYPKKIGKQVAFESYQKVVPPYPAEDVIGAATEYSKKCTQDKTEEKFILHPSTFLNKDRWKDYCFEKEATI